MSVIDEKAEEILLEGRLRVERIGCADRAVVASCASSSDPSLRYALGYDPRSGDWRCTCPVPGKRACSHLTALRRVVVAPAGDNLAEKRDDEREETSG